MKPTHRALLLINNHPDIAGPRDFGRLMWPDHPGWKRLGKSGHGVAHGVGLRLAAGGFLGRLAKRGFVTPLPPYRLTAKGIEYLRSCR